MGTVRDTGSKDGEGEGQLKLFQRPHHWEVTAPLPSRLLNPLKDQCVDPSGLELVFGISFKV